MIWLRSVLFNLVFFPLTAVLAILGLLLLAAPPRVMQAYARFWCRLSIALLRLICGIRLRITGLEHLPAGAALIAAKHQSALDTLVWPMLLPNFAYVLKRELMRIPFFGWEMRHAGMIPVDRGAGAAAMRALLRDGKAAAAEGRQIVIFPEGTRVAPGARAPYQPGIVALASATGLPVIPVATDSGRAWGRRSFRKLPGTVTVAILPPLPQGLARAELLNRLEFAIETATDRLLAGENPVDKAVDDAPAAA